jgi:hypothetical protein
MAFNGKGNESLEDEISGGIWCGSLLFSINPLFAT